MISQATTTPTNTTYDEQKFEQAALALRKLFYQPGRKEANSSGIDRYGNEQVVIYNPHRPAYWSKVTIRFENRLRQRAKPCIACQSRMLEPKSSPVSDTVYFIKHSG